MYFPLSFYLSIYFEMTQITNLGEHISEKSCMPTISSIFEIHQGIDFFKKFIIYYKSSMKITEVN